MALQSTEGRGRWPCTGVGEGGEKEPLSLGWTLQLHGLNTACGPGLAPASEMSFAAHSQGVLCSWEGLPVPLSAPGGRQGRPDLKLSVLTPGLSPEAQRHGWVGAQALLAASLSARGQRGRTFPKPHRCEELVSGLFARPP